MFCASPITLVWSHPMTAVTHFCLGFPVAVSPGDQLLHPEKKKTRAERDAEGDQVDSAHADREHSLRDSITLLGCFVIQYFRALLRHSL